MSDSTRLSTLDALEAIAVDPHIVALADLVAAELPDEGRPRHFHPHTILVVQVWAQNCWRSSIRRAVSEVRHRAAWAVLRDAVLAANPDRPDLDPGAQPLSRHHVSYMKAAHLSSEHAVDLAAKAVVSQGTSLADELGLCTGAGESWSKPSRDNAVYGDGTVVRSPTRFKAGDTRVDARTGELIQRRHDPDVTHETEGTGERKWGHKVTMLHARLGGAGGFRAVLGVGVGPEMETAMDLADEVLPRLPGAKIFIYDGALRGVHRRRLLESHRVLSVSPSPGTRNSGVEMKPLPCGTATLERADGTTSTVRIQTVGGEPFVLEVTADGDPIRLPLGEPRIKVSKRRVYGYFALEGRGTVIIRFHETADDRTADLNRMERLHPYPLTRPRGTALYGRRSDSESANNQLDSETWHNRATAYGRRAIHFGALCWALGQNAMSRCRFQRSTKPDAVAA